LTPPVFFIPDEFYAPLVLDPKAEILAFRSLIAKRMSLLVMYADLGILFSFNKPQLSPATPFHG